MGAEPPFLYEKPSSYTFSGATNQSFNPTAATQASRAAKQPKPKQDGPLIDAKELNRHPDSYFVVPYGNLDWKPMNRHTKTIVKWVRVFLLILRICAFLGTAGLLVCVICVKPVGDTLDWIIRIPPGIGLLHLTYAVYHLSRSPRGRTPGSSASYMIFAAIMDASLIPFIALTAILAHNQLYGASYNDGQQWASLFGTEFQTHTVITSTFLIGVVDGSLLVTSLIICIYLALTFRKISRLPADMNPLEDNLTARHKRNKSSISTALTEPSNRSSATPLMSPSRAVPFAHTRNDSSSDVSQPQRRAPAGYRDSQVDLIEEVCKQPQSHRSSRIDLIELSRSTPTLYSDNSRSPSRHPPSRPRSTVYSELQSTSSRPGSTVYAELARNSPRPNSFRASPMGYRDVEKDEENWTAHPSPTPSPPRFAPPELQHLRNFDPRQSHRASPPVPIKSSKYDKYDYSSRTPQPLGMNPPTPVNAEHRRSVEARALQDSNGNANTNARYGKPSIWQEIRLDNGTPGSNVSTPSARRSPGKLYGDLQSGLASGQVKRGLGRIVSSGVDAGDVGLGSNGIRAREVSGKVAEEGRARIEYFDF